MSRTRYPSPPKRMPRAGRQCFVVTLLVVAFSLPLATNPAFCEEALPWSLDSNTYERLINASMAEEDRIRNLIRELDRRDEMYKRPPEPVADLMASIFKNSINYHDKVKEIDAFYRAATTKLYQDDLKPFNEMLLEYKTIRDNAGRDNVLLPGDIAAKVLEKRVDRGERLYLGVPESALTSDPALIEKIKVYTEQQTALFGRWEEKAKRYEEEGARYAEEANKTREALLRALDPLYQNHKDYQKKLEDTFYSREYEHCLGAPASGPRSDYYGGGFADVDRSGRSLKEVPGMSVSPRTPQEFAAVYKPFGPPKAPAGFPWLQLYRSGPVVLQREAELQEARLSCARYELLDNAIEVPRYTCEVTKNFTWGMVEGVVKPFGNLADPYQTWDQALKNTGKELTYDNVVGVLEAGEGLLKEGVDAIEFGYDGLKEITTDPAAAAASMKDMLLSSGKLLQDIKGTVVGCNPLADPERPGDDASAEEWRRYAEALKGRADHVQDGAESVKNAGDWMKDHVVDNAVRSLTLYLAGKGGIEGIKSLKARSLDLWDGIKNRIESRDKGMDSVLERWKAAKEVQEKIPKDSPGSDEALKLAEKHGDIEKSIQEQIEAEAGEAKIKEIEEAAAREIFEESAKAAERTAPHQESERVRLEDGSELSLGKYMGEGSFKDVFEHPDPKKVAQVIKDPEKAEAVLDRERLTTEYLDEAGANSIKVYEEVKTEDGKIVRVVERVDPKSFGSAIIKEKGAFTAEQQAALLELTDGINKKGFIWTDPNPGNFAFVRDSTGRLAAKVTDLDNVVRLADPIGEGRMKVDLEGGEVYDLTKEKDVMALQRTLMAGNDMAPRAGWAADVTYTAIGDQLKSSRYNGGKPVPGSMAKVADAVGENFKAMTGDQVNAELTKGRETYLQEKLAGNEEYAGLVKERGKAKAALEQDAKALQNAAARGRPQSTQAGTTDKPDDMGGTDLLDLEAEGFGSLEDKLPQMPEIPPELPGGEIPQGDFVF